MFLMCRYEQKQKTACHKNKNKKRLKFTNKWMDILSGSLNNKVKMCNGNDSHGIPMGMGVVFWLLMGMEMGIALMGMGIAYFMGEK